MLYYNIVYLQDEEDTEGPGVLDFSERKINKNRFHITNSGEVDHFWKSVFQFFLNLW